MRKRTAATTGDEAGTEEENRPPARTARATKRAGSKTPKPGTAAAANLAERTETLACGHALPVSDKRA